MPSPRPAFDFLSPDLVLEAVETAFDLRLSNVVMPYTSYINRVYGLEGDDGNRYVVKFYRPGRWTTEAILEEHRFVFECAEAEVPVVAPLPNPAGTTLQIASTEADDGDAAFKFALYPSRGGRQFDAERDEDWLRLGALSGRLHAIGTMNTAPGRLEGTPRGTTIDYIEELRRDEVVHPDVKDEFFSEASSIVEGIVPLFDGIGLRRIHGDLHRGNILDRSGEGLLLIDFDDMLTGPPVQDIWLLLPDYADQSTRELELILEGYGQFGAFDRSTLVLVEPLRFMRMIHYLAWSSRQRFDGRFRESFPDWGGRAFWIKEVEDLRVQANVIRDLGL